MVALALMVQACGSASPPVEPVAVETPPLSVEQEAAPPVGRFVPTDETLGTEHPIVIQRAAADGSWVAACEAREDTDGDGEIRIRFGHHGEMFGDAARLYLFSAAHPEGEPIDRFVTSAVRGGAVAFVRDGHLVVRQGGREIDLSAAGATSAGDGNAALPDRDADFDSSGARVLYLRGAWGSEKLVVRELASGVDREIDTGAGRVWRAEFAGEGAWLIVGVVSRDTNGNGRLDLPLQRTTLARGACRGPPASYSTHGFDGDEFEWRFVRVRDGQRETRDVRGWAGDVLVVRDASGALRWVTAGGAEREIVPASCDPRFEGMWLEGPAVLVGCGGTDRASPLFVYDARGAHALGMSERVRDDRDFTAARVFPVNSAFIVDMQQARAFARAYAGEEAIRGSRVLETVEGGVVRFRDLETGAIRAITGRTESYVHGREFERFVAIRHESVLLVDLEEERIVATMPSLPIALRHDTESVSVLLDAGEHDGLSMGPLRWHRLE